MADIVVNLRDGRPIWSIPDWAVEEIRAAAPEGWTIHIEESPTDGSGDGGGGVGPGVLAALEGAKIYVGFGIPREVIREGRSLGWVHTAAAGVGGSLHADMLRSDVRFTNSAGVHGPPMAETVVGMILHFARGLDFAVAAQHRREWDDAPFLEIDAPIREIAGMTVGILGYGGIGREVARRLKPLGAELIGLRRSGPDGEIDGLGVTVRSGEDGLRELLEKSEALVVAAPDTPSTRGILTRKRIRSLPQGAVVVNIARGKLVDEEALLEALRDGHLRGAGLDVFVEEPLPPGHPFWTLPNVLITPHTSPVTKGFWRREMDLVTGNLRRFLAGEPLKNEVDRASGY